MQRAGIYSEYTLRGRMLVLYTYGYIYIYLYSTVILSKLETFKERQIFSLVI